MKYIILEPREDRLGSNIIMYISQILFANSIVDQLAFFHI